MYYPMLRDVRDNEITDRLAGRAAINDKLCNNKEGVTKIILSMLQGKKTLDFQECTHHRCLPGSDKGQWTKLEIGGA